jgi:hypothetical protein
MKIFKTVCAFTLIFLVASQTDSATSTPSTSTPPATSGNYTDAAPQTCTLTANAQARISQSECFSNLQNIIACMPPQEQDLWANANAQNTNSTKCFDCSLIKKDIKDPFKKNTEAIGKKMTNAANDKRKGLSCFSSFAKSTLTADDVNTINRSLSTLWLTKRKMVKQLLKFSKKSEMSLLQEEDSFACQILPELNSYLQMKLRLES